VPFNRNRFLSMNRGFRFPGDSIAPTYSGATIAPIGDGTDNGIAHLAFSEAMDTVTDPDLGVTLQSRQPAGTWTTITSWTGTWHGDGEKIIATLTGTTDTWQGSHEFRLSYDAGVGNITDAAGNALASITDDATLTANNSTVDLLDGLATGEHYKLADTSADINANTLTNNNSVTFVAGKVGNAADFERDSSQSLSAVDSPSLSTGDIDYYLACWIKAESLPGAYMAVVAKNDTGQKEFLLWVTGANRLKMAVNGASDVQMGTVQADLFGDLSTATWYFVEMWHDAAGNLVGIAVNATENTAATSGAPQDGTGTFYIGRDAGGGYFDGIIDILPYYKRIPSAAERTDLKNGTDGKEWPFIPT